LICSGSIAPLIDPAHRDVHTYACAYVCMCIRIHVHTYTCAYVYMCIRIHVHTYAHTKETYSNTYVDASAYTHANISLPLSPSRARALSPSLSMSRRIKTGVLRVEQQWDSSQVSFVCVTRSLLYVLLGLFCTKGQTTVGLITGLFCMCH
jgi:hypothetical protein